MTVTDPVDRVRQALLEQPHVDLENHPLRLDCADGVLTMSGELPSVAAKKLALEAAAAVPGVSGIADRLRVRPDIRRGDDGIREDLHDALLEDPAYADLTIREMTGPEEARTLAAPEHPVGCVDYAVDDGVVTLDGGVPDLLRKRLLGVSAWWIPGVRDVINGIATDQRLDDAPALADSVRRVLARDPFLDAGGMIVAADGRVVVLGGSVHSEREKLLAENDAWCVFGVDRVENQVTVREA